MSFRLYLKNLSTGGGTLKRHRSVQTLCSLPILGKGIRYSLGRHDNLFLRLCESSEISPTGVTGVGGWLRSNLRDAGADPLGNPPTPVDGIQELGSCSHVGWI